MFLCFIESIYFFQKTRIHHLTNKMHSGFASAHWYLIKAGMPQGSTLAPLVFLIHINDLLNNLISNIKRFADDTSIFSIVNNINVSIEEINNDMKQISKWA